MVNYLNDTYGEILNGRFVTIDTRQEVEGNKTFLSGITVQPSIIIEDEYDTNQLTISPVEISARNSSLTISGPGVIINDDTNNDTHIGGGTVYIGNNRANKSRIVFYSNSNLYVDRTGVDRTATVLDTYNVDTYITAGENIVFTPNEIGGFTISSTGGSGGGGLDPDAIKGSDTINVDRGDKEVTLSVNSTGVDYELLKNLPTINGEVVIGHMTSAELHLPSEGDVTNLTNSINQLQQQLSDALNKINNLEQRVTALEAGIDGGRA